MLSDDFIRLAGPACEGFAVPAATRRRWDFSRDGVRRSLEDSLERLGLDRIDIVYLHDPENHWEQATDEALPALLELREEGVVRAVGAGMNLAEPLTELIERHDVDVVMCAGRHTLLEQSYGLLDAAWRRGVGVVAAGVFNSDYKATLGVVDQQIFSPDADGVFVVGGIATRKFGSSFK